MLYHNPRKGRERLLKSDKIKVSWSIGLTKSHEISGNTGNKTNGSKIIHIQS